MPVLAFASRSLRRMSHSGQKFKHVTNKSDTKKIDAPCIDGFTFKHLGTKLTNLLEPTTIYQNHPRKKLLLVFCKKVGGGGMKCYMRKNISVYVCKTMYCSYGSQNNF